MLSVIADNFIFDTLMIEKNLNQKNNTIAQNK